MTDLRLRLGIILALALSPLFVLIVFPLPESFVFLRPIVAWLFAFIAIWVATDRLVLRDLEAMRAATRKLADGDLDARVGELDNPVNSVRRLQTNIDRMADKISDRERELEENLEEKEELLREIHHRVKNNLQIIISLLNMQERTLRRAGETEELAVLADTRARIAAMALIHQGAYEGESVEMIDLREIIDPLLLNLRGALSIDPSIEMTVHVGHISLIKLDQVIPLSLFMIEAISNSVRHGVPNGGNLSVALEQMDQQVCLTVSDDGTGKVAHAVGGMGEKLMAGFARQLSGEYKSESSESGHYVSLNFNPAE